MNEKKCLGCGIVLQTDNVLYPGYTSNLDNDFCQRCFRIQNYGDYQLVTSNNLDFMILIDNEKNMYILNNNDNTERKMSFIKKFIFFRNQ